MMICFCCVVGVVGAKLILTSQAGRVAPRRIHAAWRMKQTLQWTIWSVCLPTS